MNKPPQESSSNDKMDTFMLVPFMLLGWLIAWAIAPIGSPLFFGLGLGSTLGAPAFVLLPSRPLDPTFRGFFMYTLNMLPCFACFVFYIVILRGEASSWVEILLVALSVVFSVCGNKGLFGACFVKDNEEGNP